MFFGKADKRSINLALQGGGAHGAFTWGVLDGLLEDGRMEFDGVSGTSAGAINAVLLAHGLAADGRDGARAALEKFWTAMARSVPLDIALPSVDGQNVALMPGLKMMLEWARYFSPDQLNPLDLNPLRDILAGQVDFERVRRQSRVKLFIAATNANSGKLRLFRSPEASVDVVLASACLPMMNRTVEIDGEPYWDGGYAANPAVFPLFHECISRDILLVLLAPLTHKETPHSAHEIKSRVLDLAFNSTFLREMRMFAHLRESVGHSSWRLGRIERRLAYTNFHIIEVEEAMNQFAAETKLAVNRRFFEMLRDLGRARAATWLAQHHAHIGRRSTVDLSELFG